MNIRFYLDPKTDKFGKYRINCLIRKQNNSFAISTKAKVERKLWDKDTQRQKINSNGASELNAYLDKLYLEIEKIVNLTRAKNIFATFDDIKNAIKEYISNKGSDLFTSLEKFINLNQTKYSKETIQKYYNLKRILEEYQKLNKVTLSFAGMNKLFFDSFLNFLLKIMKHSTNTANKNIGLLNTFLRWSADRDLHNNFDFQKVRLKDEKTQHIALTLNEVRTLIKADLSNNNRLDRVRDLFLFQTFTGLRYSDLANVKRSNINGDLLQIRVIKTREPLEIILPILTLNILAKYENEKNALPILSNVKYNLYLKELAETVGISEPISLTKNQSGKIVSIEKRKYELVTTHTARRTYVSLGMQLGLRPELIMQGTGHNSLSSFQKYVKLNKKDALNEIKEIWNSIN